MCLIIYIYRHFSEFPVKKLPVFEIDSKIYTQSVAICRYFANQQGLAGNDENENLLIDSTVDTIVDLRQGNRKITIFYNMLNCMVL